MVRDVGQQRQDASQAHKGTGLASYREAGWKTYTALGERADVLGVSGTEKGAGEDDGRLHLVDLVCCLYLGWENTGVGLRFKNVDARQ